LLNYLNRHFKTYKKYLTHKNTPDWRGFQRAFQVYRYDNCFSISISLLSEESQKTATRLRMPSLVLAGSPAPMSDLIRVQNTVMTKFDASGAGKDGLRL